MMLILMKMIVKKKQILLLQLHKKVIKRKQGHQAVAGNLDRREEGKEKTVDLKLN